MQTVRIYRLDHLSKSQWNRLKAVQVEAAAVWNLCMEMHKQARLTPRSWPGRNESNAKLFRATSRMFFFAFRAIQELRRYCLGLVLLVPVPD